MCVFVLVFPEQYDAFVKFTHDQLMRRFGEQPASCKCPLSLSSHSDARSLCLPHTLMMLMLSLCRCVLSGRAVGRPRVLWLVPCPVDLCLCELLTLRPAPAGSPAVPIASFPPLGTEYVSGFCQCVTTLSLRSSWVLPAVVNAHIWTFATIIQISGSCVSLTEPWIFIRLWRCLLYSHLSFHPHILFLFDFL